MRGLLLSKNDFPTNSAVLTSEQNVYGYLYSIIMERMTTTNEQTHNQLKSLIQELAVVRGEVVLSSGLISNYYIDMRRVTLQQEGAFLVGTVMLDMLEARGYGVPNIQAVGGLTLGADPVAFAIMWEAARRGLKLDSFVVRKSSKSHGLQRDIEGPDVKGKTVIVVEDTSATGASALLSAKKLKSAGAVVPAIASIVGRHNGAKENIEANGYEYLTAYDLSELDVD